MGIDDYPGGERDLRSARSDAATFDDMLAQAGVPSDHRLVLEDTDASSDNLRRAVDWLVARAAPGATAILFYAGHVSRLGPGHEAILAADLQLVDDQELARRLQVLQAEQAWIVLATCYGGGFNELLAPGRLLTAAAGPTKEAFESDRLGHSYLVEYMIKRSLLHNQDNNTVQDAFQYAEREIQRKHPDRVPVQYDQTTAPLRITGTSASTGN